MGKPSNIKLAALLSLIYIILNTVLIAYEFYYLSLLPIAIFFVLALIYRLNWVYLLVAFVTPLSINLAEFGYNQGLSIPAEPILAVLMVIFLLKIFHEPKLDRALFRHPVSWSLYLYFAWMLVTVIASNDMVVSAKWYLAHLWLIIPTYFFGIIVFKEFSNIYRFVWAYVLGLLLVIFFTLYVHASYHFSDHAAHWAMSPFYNDHTSYGALLAMYIPIILGFGLSPEKYSRNIRIFAVITFFILLIALYFSISRAAWASVVIAIGAFFFIRFRIKLWWVMGAGVGLLVLFMVFQSQIMMKLQKNKQDSSKDFVEHVQSMSNVATDASNLERINRWNSAINLFAARPVFGWGPGNYQFVYASYQNVEDKTVISTNVGNRGTAHSEYLLILSEQGLPGLLSLLTIFVAIVSTAIRIIYRNPFNAATRLTLLLFLGLITYLTHAFFNNFLDTDKAAIPFWGFAAALVAIDLYHLKDNKEALHSNEMSEITEIKEDAETPNLT